jgi:hypothetical protein
MYEIIDVINKIEIHLIDRKKSEALAKEVAKEDSLSEFLEILILNLHSL